MNLIVIANIFQPLIDVNNEILKFWHGITGSWGVAIIGMTVVVRLIILPLTYKQVKSMQDLQRFQPEMKRIQARYKEDKQRMQQEMMKFYKEHNFNPLSSCLPLILQLPFFMSLFYLLRSPEFKHEIKGEESFLFIPNLAAKATGGVLVVLIILYVGTQLGASAVTALRADRQQRIIMFALPFVFTFFIINFPAGLIVYWITTNLWTVGQQLAVKKFLPKPDPIEPKSEEGTLAHGKTPTPAPAGAAALAGEGDTNGGGLLDRARAALAGGSANGGEGDGKSGAKTGGGKSGGKGTATKAQRKTPPPQSPRKRKRKRSGRRR
jgi:YidC/Oxa1 family membrane protein insertase